MLLSAERRLLGGSRRPLAARILCALFFLTTPQLGAADLRALRSELSELAVRDDGTASAENLAVRARIRSIIAEAAALASRGGESYREAWDFLEEAFQRRERNAAMEAALALIDSADPEGVRRLLRSAKGADAAVRRQAFRTLALSARGAKGAFAELRSALEAEDDPESATALVSLLSREGTLEAARVLVARSPPPPRGEVSFPSGGEPARDDRFGELREAIVAALVAAESREAKDWLRSEAFRECRRPGSLWVAARVAGLKRFEEARSHLEELLEHSDFAVAQEALRALSAIGLGGSRERLEKIAAAKGLDPRLAGSAALALAKVDPEAGWKALSELSERPLWTHREAAARALGELPEEERAFRRCLELLEDRNREVRAAAFSALRSFRRNEAVPAAINLLSPFRGSDPDRVAEYLEWASGLRLGKDRVAWLEWWKEAERDFRFPETASRANAAGRSPREAFAGSQDRSR